MGSIVSAIRGGPGSKATVARAIALAKETELPLYFLYVVNLDFMDRVGSSRVHVISEEMHEMGEFVLLAAQEEAAKAGVEATGVVREGKVTDEIVALCHEVSAAFLVIGRPRAMSGDNVFTDHQHPEVCRLLESETGARVIIPEAD